MLMQEIDASRTPVREALNRLEQEGLLKIIPKKGIIVSSLSLQEVNMTFEARLLLEPYIIENYMEFIDRKKLEKIRALIEEQLSAEAPDKKTFDILCETDDVFHRTLVAGCRNHYLNDCLAHIYDQNMRIRRLAGNNIWKRHVGAAQEHIEIIDYVLRGQKEEAKLSAKVHLIHSREAAVKSLLEEPMPMYP